MSNVYPVEEWVRGYAAWLTSDSAKAVSTRRQRAKSTVSVYVRSARTLMEVLVQDGEAAFRASMDDLAADYRVTLSAGAYIKLCAWREFLCYVGTDPDAEAKWGALPRCAAHMTREGEAFAALGRPLRALMRRFPPDTIANATIRDTEAWRMSEPEWAAAFDIIEWAWRVPVQLSIPTRVPMERDFNAMPLVPELPGATRAARSVVLADAASRVPAVPDVPYTALDRDRPKLLHKRPDGKLWAVRHPGLTPTQMAPTADDIAKARLLTKRERLQRLPPAQPKKAKPVKVLTTEEAFTPPAAPQEEHHGFKLTLSVAGVKAEGEAKPASLPVVPDDELFGEPEIDRGDR